MSLREEGKAYSRAVPKEDYEWIERMTSNFQSYREKRRELSVLDLEIKNLLDDYEEQITNQTKKGRAYLEIGKSQFRKENAKTAPKITAQAKE